VKDEKRTGGSGAWLSGTEQMTNLAKLVLMVRGARTKEWVVYLLGGNRAHRLKTVAAPDKDAAIAKAIEFFDITDPERQKRVAVSPME
jgi:hypothetical protein